MISSLAHRQWACRLRRRFMFVAQSVAMLRGKKPRARTSERRRRRRRRRRRPRVGGVGVRDGGSEWRRGERTRGGAGAHTRSAPRHITSLDGRMDGQMEAPAKVVTTQLR